MENFGKICFVTKELYELTQNGGIGTATTHIAKLLANRSFEIDVLFTEKLEENQQSSWQQFYKNKHNINLSFVEWHYCEMVEPWQAKSAFAIYQYFKKHQNKQYDLIIFHDYMGESYYCFNAREAGLLFANTRLGMLIHGTQQWCYEANKKFLPDANNFLVTETEKACIERADFIISPSQYMVDWMRAKHWRLPPPNNIFILQNIISESDNSVSITSSIENKTKKLQEIVFFGRLEQRKGIYLFCDAIKKLDLYALGCKKLTFLGRGVEPPETIQNLIASSQQERLKICFKTQLNSSQAKSYIAKGDKLIIMPSLDDNSPCVVMECLAMSIPFITTTAGGMCELIHEEDHHTCISEPYPHKLAEKITHYLTSPAIVIPKSSKTFTQNCNDYVHVLNTLIAANNNISAKTNSTVGNTNTPLVTVIITHFNRGKLLTHAVQSVLAQTYKNFELIIVDDGSTHRAPLHELEEQKINNLQIIYQQNAYVGAARNTGIKAANGEFIAFLDDDNVWKKNFLEVCVRTIQHANADCISTGIHFFHKQKLCPTVKDISNGGWLYFGSDILCTGAIRNTFGDGSLLCRKTSIEKFGFFHEKFNVGNINWAFLANIAVQGGKILCLPELLCFYRTTEKSMSRVTDPYSNQRIIFDTYAQHGHWLVAKMGELVHGQALHYEKKLAKIRAQESDSQLIRLPSLTELANGAFFSPSSALTTYYKWMGKLGQMLTKIPRKNFIRKRLEKLLSTH